MHIGNRRVVKEHSKNKNAKKNEVLESDLSESDITFEHKEKGKTVRYQLGGLAALDLNFKDYYDTHAPNPDSSFRGDAVPMLKWLSTVCDSEVDFDLARAQGRKKGDGKGPWPSTMKDNQYTMQYLLLTNDIVNINFFAIQQHPKLQWLLMSMVGAGEIQNHQWLPLATQKQKSNSIVDEILFKVYPNMGASELELLKNISSKEDIEELAKNVGYEDKDVKKVVKEFEKQQEK